MTVSSATNEATFPGNGVATVFPLPFRFFANSDIIAQLINSDTGSVAGMTLGVDYTLAGAGDPEVNGSATGVLTTVAPVPTGFSVFVRREIPLTQPTDIVNQGRFYPEIHETVFDRLTMITQQIFSKISSALLKVPVLGYYDAAGSQIKNLADPTATQDAATRGWAETYLGGLVAAITGNANLASGVGYTTPRTALGLVQDMSNTTDPLKGAAYVARAIRHINSLTELRATPGQYDGEVVYLRGRTSATAVGRGSFRWFAAATTTDDDGITISPGGTGRWVREYDGSEVDAGWYGASASFSQAVNTAAIQAAVNAANALAITIVRLPGKGIFLCAAITGAAAITFVSDRAYFDDFLFSVEQAFKSLAVVMPSSFSWASAWRFYAGGAPGIAKTSLTVEKAWSANEAQGIVNYYVNPVSGNDANSGSVNNPFKTIGAAINAASVGVVNLMPGTYYDGMGASIGNTVLRDIVFQTFSGGRDVVIRNAPDPATQTWALVASTIATYENTAGALIYRVVDTSIVDANGDFIDLRPRASLAEVTANPGSFFYDSGTGKVYVRRYTNTAPGTALLTFRTNSPLYFQGRAVLLRNLQFEGGGGLQALESGGTRARLYAVNTSVKYMANNGIATLGGTSYLERCTIGKSLLDNLNYHVQNGIEARAVEIDVVSYRAGDFVQKGWQTHIVDTQNASSMHDAGSVIRVNGVYSSSYGPVLPDTGTSSSMNIGVVAENSLGLTTQNAAIYSDGGMYLIDSHLRGSTYDIRTASGGTVYVRNVQMAGSISREGGGKIQQF